jgi:hypothetical protein
MGVPAQLVVAIFTSSVFWQRLMWEIAKHMVAKYLNGYARIVIENASAKPRRSLIST